MKRFQKILYLIAIAILLTNCSKSKTNLKSESKTNLKSESKTNLKSESKTNLKNESKNEIEKMESNKIIDIDTEIENLVSRAKFVYMTESVLREFIKRNGYGFNSKKNDNFEFDGMNTRYETEEALNNYFNLFKTLTNVNLYNGESVFYIYNKDKELRPRNNLFGVVRVEDFDNMNVVTTYPENDELLLSKEVDPKVYNKEQIIKIIRKHYNKYKLEFVNKDIHSLYNSSKNSTIDEIMENFNSINEIKNSEHFLILYHRVKNSYTMNLFIVCY